MPNNTRTSSPVLSRYASSHVRKGFSFSSSVHHLRTREGNDFLARVMSSKATAGGMRCIGPTSASTVSR